MGSRQNLNTDILEAVPVVKNPVTSKTVIKRPIKIGASRGPNLNGCWFPVVNLRKGNRRLRFSVYVAFPPGRHGLQDEILKIPGTTIHHPVIRGTFVIRVPTDGFPESVVLTCNVFPNGQKNTHASGNGKLATKKRSLNTRKEGALLP